MKLTALRQVSRNVVDLEPAARFYTDALGFQAIGAAIEDPLLAKLLGVQRLRILRMRLGAQEIELSECYPPSTPYPRDMAANNLGFQHIAIITTDITNAYNKVLRLGAKPMSSSGPVHLPVSSGGVFAIKFRDLDGHPLEYLQFPKSIERALEGFDHSAICISDVEKSVAFYTKIGLRVTAQQVNRGSAQDTLDGLTNVSVAVVALRPPQPTPHLELLCYRAPKPHANAPYMLADICADRLVFASMNGELQLLRDPDGHVILVDGR